MDHLMGATVGQGDQSRTEVGTAAAVTSTPLETASSAPGSPTPPTPASSTPTSTSPRPLAVPSVPTGSSAFDLLAVPNESVSPASPAALPGAPDADPRPDPTGPIDLAPIPFSLSGLVLLDGVDDDPVDIDSLTFADAGIGVVRTKGEPPRILPWSSVTSHMVEAWAGGIVPEWWVDPELNRNGDSAQAAGAVIDPGATNRPQPQAEPGALIGIRTNFGTYRFLLPGGDAREISRRITGFAVRNQGPGGASSVTRVVAWGVDIERRKVKRRPPRKVTWSKLQPIMVVVLVLFLATAAALILLQSAGTIHLPFLGGPAPGTVLPLRIR